MQKEVDIIIHCRAEHDEEANSPIDFDQLVNIYFRNNKLKLKDIFDTIGDVKANSVLRDFQFDSVEKQIR